MTPYQTPEKIKLKFDAIKEPKEFWKGKTVLDIGCCSGMLYPLLKECGIKSYTGIDLSMEYIYDAKSNYPDVDFFLADLKTFEGNYDIGISLSTLHILDDNEFEKALEKYSKQCKTFIFEVPVIGTAPIYYTRDEETNIFLAKQFFENVLCYGVSPSPHDPKSTRKVFKCWNQ